MPTMPQLGRGNLLLYDEKEKEELVLQILSADSSVPHKLLAKRVNRSRETVRKIRYGKQWPDILPHLPRHSTNRHYRCTDCNLCDLKNWQCSIGMAGSIGDDGILNRRYAIDCAAYSEDPAITSLFGCNDETIIQAAADRLYKLGLTKTHVSFVLRRQLSDTPEPSPMFDTYPPTPQAAATLQPQRFTIGETWRGPDGPDRQPGRNYRVCTAPNHPLHVRLMSVGGGADEIVPIAATVGYTLVAPAKPGGRF